MSKMMSQLNKEKWLWLLCFVLGFFAWQAIRQNISFQLLVSNVPVEIEVPEEWAVLEKSVEAVDIRLVGAREDARDINNVPLRVVIPIKDPQPGEVMEIELKPDFLKNNPTDAKVARFSPSTIEVTLDRRGSKRLPVKASYQGELPEGFVIENIVCTPAAVVAHGATQQLGSMETLHTEVIQLKNRTTSFKVNAQLDLPQDGRLQVEPDRVSVEFVLAERSSTATFEKVPVRVLLNPGERRRVDVQPLTVDITLSGGQQKIDALKASDLFAYVTCTELTQSAGYELPIRINLPAGVRMIKSEPAAVRVEIGNLN